MGLSVAMCTYNGARFLHEQLESIASQSRIPDELVVCDDGSTDGTIEILERFARCAPFAARLEINKSNLGTTKNFEKAIGKCGGEIIALADQDDVWVSKKLELMESVFLTRPSVGVVFSDAEVVDESRVAIGFRLWNSVGFSPGLQRNISNGRGTEVLLHHNVVTGAAMAFRSELRKLVLPISEKWIHDGWIALLASVVADLSFIREPLIKYRKHASQQTGPGPSNFVERLARAKRNGADGYQAFAEQFAAARERLLTIGDDPRCRAAIPQFDLKIRHLKARAQIERDRNRASRVPRIVKELVSRRYHCFSEGWESAAKDFLL